MGTSALALKDEQFLDSKSNQHDAKVDSSRSTLHVVRLWLFGLARELATCRHVRNDSQALCDTRPPSLDSTWQSPVYRGSGALPPLIQPDTELPLTMSFRRSLDSGKLVLMTSSLVVICKNAEFHSNQPTFEGYRITVTERFDIPMRIRCDSCGKWFDYDPKDIIFVMSTNDAPATTKENG